MSHRFHSLRSRYQFVRLVFRLSALAVIYLIAASAFGQNLAFNPGLASSYAGDPTGSKAQSSSSYTGPLSGLVLSRPNGIAQDGNGNLYIADSFYSSSGGGYFATIRVIASGKGAIPAAPAAGNSPQAGTVYPIAGNGGTALDAPCTYPGTAIDQYGNGCAATNIDLSAGSPTTSVAVDAQGNVYFVDQHANEIRVIYGGGSIPGLSHPVAGNVYAVAGNGTSGSTGDAGPALSAELNYPAAVGADSHGNIYINDDGNFTIRVVYAGGSVPGVPSSPTPGYLYTIAGTLGTSCGYSSTTCGDDGPATSAEFSSDNPGQVAIDPSGNIYIADSSNLRVRAIYVAGALPGISNPTVGDIYTVAGGGTGSATSGHATNSSLTDPVSIAFDTGGAFYFTDDQAKHAYRVDAAGGISSVFGGAPVNAANVPQFCSAVTDADGDGCATNDAVLSSPEGIVVDSTGNIFIADELHNLVREAAAGSSSLEFSGTFGVAVSPLVISVSNTGAQPLQLGNLTASTPFSQMTTGGSTDCDSSTLLQPGTSCQISISVTPTQAGTLTGTFQVSSNSLNATNGVNVVNLTAVIAPAASSAVLTASPAPPAQAGPGQPVTFTATVYPQSGVTTIPTGTVTFNNGTTALGTGTLNASGVATFTTTSFSAGSYGVTAVYSGDTNFSTSTSNIASATVASAAVSTVTLTASPANTTTGQSVTLTATVTPPSGGAAPTGTIVFQNGIAPISSAIPLSGGSATFSTTTLPAGNNTLYAAYSGNLPANDSNGVVVTVSADAQLLFIPGVISDFAGNYSGGYAGDGGTATSAELSDPSGIAYDSAGNLYIADASNNVVRVVASGKGTIPGIANPVAGDIYTVAGVQGKTCSTANLPCGDGGAATAAYLNFGYQGIAGVAVDAAGNIYIADSFDYVVRKVTPSGIITTVAGTLQSSGYSGDGGAATQAKLSYPSAVAVDNAGNLYVADNSSGVVRRIDAQTRIITTIAGSTAAAGTYSGDGGPANAAGLYQPQAIALDAQSNLYIADTSNQVVRKVNLQTGIISTVAGSYYIPKYNLNCCDTGDGGPATQAQLHVPQGIWLDEAGNLYIADASNLVVRMVDAQTGIIDTIAGTALSHCSVGPCGDGGLATSATFGEPFAITQDAAGDLLISDQYPSNVVRQITAGSTALNFGTPNLGTIVGQSVTVTNTGAQPLTISGITASAGFTQAASGGTDCTESTTLAPAQQCAIDVQFFPTAAQAYSGTLMVASNSSNATSGNNTIALTGTGVANSGTQTQSISFPTPQAPYNQGTQIALGAVASSGLPVQYFVSGPGLVLNNGTANASLKITGAGPITVTAYQFGDSTYAAATPVPVSFTAVQPILTITAQNESITLGQAVPPYTSASDYVVTGLIPGDSLSGQPSLSVVNPSTQAVVPVGSIPDAGQYTLAIAQGSLVVPSYYKLNFVNGTFTVSGSNQQTVVFTALPTNLTYGAAPVTLTAIANDTSSGKADGLPITFSTTSTIDTISGNLLSIGGAGPVTVLATQPGNSFYASATATQSTVVAKAPLSVTANNQTLSQGVGLPSLNSPGDYVFGQFQSQETAAVLTGAPVLTIVDGNGNAQAPGSTPAVGTYTIQISQGSLSSSNYAFNFVNGTFTVVKGQSQTISFPAISNLTYGAAPITLNASVSSGLGVVYSVTSGPATIAGNTLSIHGVGAVTVQASQAGNSTYAPASATQTLNVGPAQLTVIASNVTRDNNVANPPLTGYAITGLVNGDTQAVVSGTPLLTTTAVPGSPIGTYPIVISSNTQFPITAANYVFTFVNGTLTVTSGGPAPDFSLTATPAVLGIPQGQLMQTTVTLTPTNYYQGTLKLSCGNLPSNMTCVFSPSALNADGTGNPVSGTVTINTNGSSSLIAKVVSQSDRGVFSAALFLPGEFLILLLTLYGKKRTKKIGMMQLLVLLVLLAGAATITACGGGSSSANSPYAAPGAYNVSVTATDTSSGISHATNVTVDVQ